jgi:acetyl-CoA acyltransferase
MTWRHPAEALVERNAGVDWQAVDDVVWAAPTRPARTTATSPAWRCCWPAAGRRPGSTVNRLCGSGLDAVGAAARAIKAGEAELMIAGGVESMSRAPFVMPKAETAFSRNAEIFDTTIGWRFVNPALMKAQYGVDSMPETGENVAEDFGVSRADQDAFALRSQAKAPRRRPGQAGARDHRPSPSRSARAIR